MAIGIFDSGIGGLTVFRALRDRLPRQDLIYLGDTARVPYGTKSRETVTRYARQNVRFLLAQEVRLVVIACNTASAFALPELEQELAVPVVGVIAPGIEGALQKTRNGKIGVIGTEGTIASGVYVEGLKRRRPSVAPALPVEVVAVPCPLFVPLVEEGMVEGEIPEAVARQYLGDLIHKGIDTLILGCTHYPLLKPTLRKIAGDRIALVDSAEETAAEVDRLLAKEGLLEEKNRSPRRTFFVTDHPDRFRRVGGFFLGGPLDDVHQVDV